MDESRFESILKRRYSGGRTHGPQLGFTSKGGGLESRKKGFTY